MKMCNEGDLELVHNTQRDKRRKNMKPHTEVMKTTAEPMRMEGGTHLLGGGFLDLDDAAVLLASPELEEGGEDE